MDWLINPISGVMKWALTVFYNLTVDIGFPNYGVAIILLTIVIKMLLYPLIVKQTKSLNAMSAIAPKMKMLQEKHKDNKEKLNAEMSRLFKESGVNPAAGCLPMLIQMPFLIAIFYALKGYEYVSDPSFLWIKNLAENGDPYYILPVLAAVTTYVMSKQTSAGTDANPQAKVMTNFMPFFIGYITHTFPAGLGLYWVVSNLVQIAQQWWIHRATAAQGEAR